MAMGSTGSTDMVKNMAMVMAMAKRNSSEQCKFSRTRILFSIKLISLKEYYLTLFYQYICPKHKTRRITLVKGRLKDYSFSTGRKILSASSINLFCIIKTI